MRPCCAVLALISLAAICGAQAKPKIADLQGTYEVRLAEPGQKVPVAQDPKTTTSGQIRHFVISGNHWILYDSMSGFEGDLQLKGDTVTLITTSGASGNIKKGEKMVFKFSKPCTLSSLKPNLNPVNLMLVRITPRPSVNYLNGSWKQARG
jgi:hypothetical protein